MVRTQVQLPDEIYREAKRIAAQREISLAEVVRRGLEYMSRLYPAVGHPLPNWELPDAQRLGPFRASPDQWRDLANEPLRSSQKHQ